MVLLAGLLLRIGLLDEARALLAEKEIAGNRSETIVRNGSGLARQLEALKSAMEKLEAKLIRSDNVGKNQQYFYEHETAAGVKISVLRAQGLPKTKGKVLPLFPPVAYNVVVEGAFPQLVTFLSGLEQGEHHYRLVSFTLQRAGVEQPGAKGGKVILNINLELLASS
ncbi:MAG: hypothetical protein IPL39_17120 [Opitutaceae bacterium]|nr:hypothetical protein [Opitutaceae bacterium]